MDLVERLRAYLMGDQLYHPLICDEAADEIERLRAALEKIAALELSWDDGECYPIEIATKALAG